VAAQNHHDPGVLVLSRFAGAARELDAALIVNPYDFDAVADAIASGLEMSLEERRKRWTAMMETVRNNTFQSWGKSFLKVLKKAPYE
jgi:trehalose 6-phosphate synthase